MFEASLPSQCPQIYEKLKLWHLEVSERAGVIRENLGKFISLPGKTLLDFGCGEGGVAIYFARNQMAAFGADITEPQLERTALRAKQAQVENKTMLINGQGRLPQVPDDQFDVIICHDVIEHCPEPEVTIQELTRLVNKEGLIYLTAPNRIGLTWIFSNPHYNLPLVSILPKSIGDVLVRRFRKMENNVTRMFTPIGLTRLFRKNGLEVIYSYPDEAKEKLARPAKIKSPFKKRIFNLLDKSGTAPLILLAMPLLHLFSNALIFILKKEQ